MTTAPHFDLGKGSVARSYDDVLVPLIFRPWGERLLDEHGPWDGRTVLDLATGTGVVARLLADRVGPDGQVIAADINPQMLAVGKDHCKAVGERVRFVNSAIELALATPIGPHLRELAESLFNRFTDELSARAAELSRGESHLGELVSNVIVARK